MKNILVIACILFLSACNKVNEQKMPLVQEHDFFKDKTDMQQMVQIALQKLSPGEKLEGVESVSYIDSKDKRYAFVFYRSNKRAGNVVLQKQYVNSQLVAASASTCEGADCACQVTTIISNSGTVTLGCSCKSCTLLTTTSAPITQ